jgi:uncharacterized UPF0160 family protein
MKLVTHNGVFHADDVLACAILSYEFEFEIEIVRSRNSVSIETADILVDVGGEYNPVTLRFDHHQKGGAGARENGVPYASAGLVWLNYGPVICQKVLAGIELGDLEFHKISELVDKSLICGVDARDNGMKTHYGINNAEVYSFSDLITAFNPNWFTVQDFSIFNVAVDMAKVFLVNEIRRQAGSVLAEVEIIKMIEPQKGKKIVLLEKYVPWSNILPVKAPETSYVVFPDPTGSWRVQAVPKGVGKESFELKAPFPANWRGSSKADLQNLTGVEDVIFCHNAGFIMGTKTREGAISCAQLALLLFEREQELR